MLLIQPFDRILIKTSNPINFAIKFTQTKDFDQHLMCDENSDETETSGGVGVPPNFLRLRRIGGSPQPPEKKTLDGYMRLKHRVEQELGHTMVDSAETWVEKRYKIRSKPYVICGRCGTTCKSAQIDSIMTHGNGIGCVKCFLFTSA